MISPKYSPTHYFFKPAVLSPKAPNVINLYLDYNCPFSAKIFTKLANVIPRLQEKHPGAYQFVFVNVIQPWHPNSVMLHEYSLKVAQLLVDKDPDNSNELFWKVSSALFDNKEVFYDSVTVTKGRNEIYKLINDIVSQEVDLPFTEREVLSGLEIKETNLENASNFGNDTTADVKYFTKYLRGVGVHVTPTVSINGIVDNSVSSGMSEEELIKLFDSLC